MPQFRNIFRVGGVLIFTLFFAGFFVLHINFAEAILGPSQPPGSGGGSLSVDANQNLGFNTSVVGTTTAATPPYGNFSRVFMIAATSSPPGVGLRSVASSCPSTGCSGQQLYPSTWVWRLTPWGFMELINATDQYNYDQGPVMTFMGGNTYNRRVMIGNFYTSTSTMYDASLGVIGNIKSTGNVTGNSFVGNLSGSVSAGNVTGPAAFGSNYGTYNFAAPGAFAIGTSVTTGLPSNGLYVVGNVGIGTTSPGAKLHVLGTTDITQQAIFESPYNVTAAGYYGGIQLGNYTGNQNAQFLFNAGGSNTLDIRTNYNSVSNKITLSPGTVTTMTLLGSGYVGIGTTSPAAGLHVAANAAAIPSTTATPNGSFIIGGNNTAVIGSMGIYNAAPAYFWLQPRDGATATWYNTVLNPNGGNVGIATTTPTTAQLVIAPGANSAIDAGGGKIINISTPTANGDAATKSYVDSVLVGAGQWTTTSTGVYYNSGNVGIGTASPGAKLDVNGSGIFRSTVSINSGDLYFTKGASTYIGTLDSQDLILGTNSTEKVRVQSGGNVGIGTVGPRSKLDVNGGMDLAYAASTLANNASAIRWENGSSITSAFGFVVQNGVWYQGSNDVGNQDFGVRGGTVDGSLGTVNFVVKGNGNVGIATTTPSYKLDVVGGGQFSQPIIVGTPTAANHAATKSYVDSSITNNVSQWTTTSTGIYYNSGNVGIGTASPNYSLQIASGGLKFGTDSTGSGTIVPSGGTNLYIKGLTIDSSGSIFFADANGNIRMGVRNDGNVGIGTTAPTTRLNVRGAIAASISDTQIIGKIYDSANDGFLELYTGDVTPTSRVKFSAYGDSYVASAGTGNVGIGTASPNYKLDVAGTSQFSQPVIVGTPTASTHAATKSYVDSVVGGGAGTGNFATLSVSGTSTLATTAGNVGIGTTTPGAKLSVAEAGGVYPNPPALGASGGTFQFLSDAGKYGLIGGTSNTGNTWLQVQRVDGIAAAYNLLLQPTGGNVGIGTTAPGYKLDVLGPHGGGINYSSTNGISGDAHLSLQGKNAISHYGGYSTTRLYVGDGYSDVQVGVSNLSQSVNLLVTGNVGIGTTGPSTKLAVNGEISVTANNAVTFNGAPSAGGQPYMYYNSSDNVLYLVSGVANSKLNFGSTVGSQLVIIPGGNVGIATTTPSYKLDVVGTSQFSQPVIVGTPTAGTHAATKSYVDSMFTGSGQWTTSGSTVYLTNTGYNVGIGTTTPDGKLAVTGEGTGVARIGVSGCGGNYVGIGLNGAMSGCSNYSVLGGDNNLFFNRPTGGNMYFRANNSDQMVILSGGNVGIGTTNPNYKLEVGSAGTSINPGISIVSTGGIAAANGNKVLYLWNDGTTLKLDAYDYGVGTSVPFKIGENGGSIYMVTNGGNVGIATTTPSYKLDVVGTSQFSQPVIVGTPTANSHAATKSYVDSMFTGSGQWTTNGGLVYLTSTTQSVGIGTTAPGSYKLNVTGTGYFGDAVTYGSAGRATWTSDIGGGQPAFIVQGLSGYGLSLASNAGASNVFINTAGNVGIGTTAPTYPLDININQNNYTGLKLQNSNTGTLARSGIEVYTDKLSFDIRVHGSGWTGYSRFGINMANTAEIVADQFVSGGVNALLIGTGANSAPIVFGTNGFERVRIDGAGNVGIGTTGPSYKLDVNGYGSFNQPLLVGTPTAAGHAATKSYVDSIVGGGAGSGSFTTLAVSATSTLSGNWQLGGASMGNVNLNGYNIVGVNKITASVIDPIYNINGVKYATYGSDTIGIKTEMFGKATLQQATNNKQQAAKQSQNSNLLAQANFKSQINSNIQSTSKVQTAEYLIPGMPYSATLDFSSAEKGSDLWLFWQTINAGQNMKDIVITLTPEFDGRVWYELHPKEKQISIYGSPTSINQISDDLVVSYHLVAPRHDADEWGNKVKNQKEDASFILQSK